MINFRSLLFLITTIAIISGGELKISANNYILPTKALFDYVDGIYVNPMLLQE